MGRTRFIVLNWNGLDLTRACLRSLRDAGIAEGDVLLVDNASTDGSREAIPKEFPGLDVLALAANLGYAGGNNRGLEATLDAGRWPFALVLNNDTLVTRGMVERLEAALDADAALALVQPKIAFFDRATIENAGFMCDRFGVTAPRGRGAPIETRFDAESFFYASGACMLARLDALRHVGLFDEAYFVYHEDVDLSWRLRVAGWRVALVDEALCYHGESMTAGHGGDKIGRIWRNRQRTLLKNVSGPRLAWVVPVALALTLGHAAGASMKARRPRLLGLYFRAIGWNVRHLRDTLRERRRVQSLRRARERDVVAHQERGSLEWRLSGRRRPPS